MKISIEVNPHGPVWKSNLVLDLIQEAGLNGEELDSGLSNRIFIIKEIPLQLIGNLLMYEVHFTITSKE